MLQRIQSLLLLLSGIGMVVFLGTNSWEKSGSEGSQVIVNPYHVVELKGTLAVQDHPVYYIAVLAVLAAGVSFFSIFQYKNRVRQMLLVALNSLFMGLAIGLTIYQIKYVAMPMGETGEGTFGIGVWAGFFALLSNWVANRAIRRDEKLVKDADRMR